MCCIHLITWPESAHGSRCDWNLLRPLDHCAFCSPFPLSIAPHAIVALDLSKRLLPARISHLLFLKLFPPPRWWRQSNAPLPLEPHRMWAGPQAERMVACQNALPQPAPRNSLPVGFRPWEPTTETNGSETFVRLILSCRNIFYLIYCVQT